MSLLLLYERMRKFLYRGTLLILSLAGLVSCATSDMSDSSSTAKMKSSVPGADDPDRAGTLSPAGAVNGAGASMKF
jgi:hypothetical protein